MWTHLERQSGGKVKGMGEKQIEVDKRILRNQVSKQSFRIMSQLNQLRLLNQCAMCLCDSIHEVM